jgi:hypothetical protein
MDNRERRILLEALAVAQGRLGDSMGDGADVLRRLTQAMELVRPSLGTGIGSSVSSMAWDPHAPYVIQEEP